MSARDRARRVRGRRGTGSQRERRPGVWEIRVPDADRPGTRRSYTVQGSAADAAAIRSRLVTAELGIPAPAVITVAEVLTVWVEADHPWKPSTLVGYRSVVRYLTGEQLGAGRAGALTPQAARSAIARWQSAGVSAAVVASRFRVLRSALGWAWTERVIDEHRLRAMRGPAPPPPRHGVAAGEVRALLVAAELRLLEVEANHDPESTGSVARVQRAEQDLLLVRLAADTGARRGELAALRFDDLAGRSLTITRAVSAGQLTVPKSGRSRTLTVGTSTAVLWHTLAGRWAQRATQAGPPEPGPWLFAGDPRHQHRLGAEVLGHRFANVAATAGVSATLHQLRHAVATLLVSQGQVLAAQQRLGHADAATTLRVYCHALPGTDHAAADTIDAHLQPREEPSEQAFRP